MSVQIRPYAAADEDSWLRCRALSFLGTCYYDDVRTNRPTSPAVQLVATLDETVVGVLDIEIAGELATIDTVAVHPDHQGDGIATALLTRAQAELPRSVTTLDAWTRDEPTLQPARRSEHSSLDVTAGLCRPRSVEIGRSGILPVTVQQLDLLGQHTRDGEFRQFVDGVPGHFAGLVADEVGIQIAQLIADEEELVDVPVVGRAV